LQLITNSKSLAVLGIIFSNLLTGYNTSSQLETRLNIEVDDAIGEMKLCLMSFSLPLMTWTAITLSTWGLSA